MKKIAMLAIIGLMATPALADTWTYGWEDGTGTILGSFGNLVDDTNVTGAQVGQIETAGNTFNVPGAAEGNRYLHVAESPHSSTPQAYLAWITGLEDGDVIDASFFGFDTTSGASPSLRIWGAYTNDVNDINSYEASASGPLDYTAGSGGWDEVTTFGDASFWTFDSDFGARNGLVIQARLYSTPSTADPAYTDFFIDDLTVEVTSLDGEYTIHTPGYTEYVPEPATLSLLALGGLALIRRR